MNLELNDITLNRLKRLKDKTGAKSYLEVTEKALELYEFISKQTEEGNAFILKDTGNRVTKLEFWL